MKTIIKNNFNFLRGIKLALMVFAVFFSLSSHAFALTAGIHIPEKYTDVVAGEKFYFELELKYPENPKRKDLRLEYQILKDGEVVARSKFLKAVEAQASFMDYVVIPESAEKGLHDINVVMSDYDGDLHEEVSASFYVKGSESELNIYFYVLLAVVFIVFVLVVWEMKRLSALEKNKK